MSCLGLAAGGHLSQTALRNLQSHFLNYIAHLQLESQAMFPGNCRRRGGLSPYWPAVYPRGQIPLSKAQ